MTTPQEQPEEEHEKFEWKNCERCGLQYGLHSPSDGHLFVGAPYANTTPQQTEQWMEEFVCLWNKVVMSVEVQDACAQMESFIKSQIEAAYQRGRNDGAEAEAVRDSIHHQP